LGPEKHHIVDIQLSYSAKQASFNCPHRQQESMQARNNACMCMKAFESNTPQQSAGKAGHVVTTRGVKSMCAHHMRPPPKVQGGMTLSLVGMLTQTNISLLNTCMQPSSMHFANTQHAVTLRSARQSTHQCTQAATPVVPYHTQNHAQEDAACSHRNCSAADCDALHV
jgi:hypothetical protein